MSYILDALKKAERERGIAEVPTLGTVHETTVKPRTNIWILPFIILILFAAGTGLYLYTGNGTGVDITDTADTASKLLITEQPDAISVTSPGTTPVERNKQPLDSTTTRNRTITASSNTTFENESNVPSEAESSAASSIEEDLNYSQEDPPLLSEPASSPADTSSRMAVLQQAIQEMRVSIHLYSRVPANRMIFINGRKYVEGDYVNKVFLIESITQDGAVLSYEGIQSTLNVTM